jgi:polyisoprenoid-binding protein YceI
MKIIIYTLFICCTITICQAQERLNIDTFNSSIKWTGEYTFYFGGHEGFINFTKGYLLKTNDTITGGSFIINMNSITNTDIEVEDANKSLVEHLKSADFFNVKNYPTSKLVITKIEYTDATHSVIKGDLTIKNITKPINFRAEFDPIKREINSKFKIDRTLWGITYNNSIKDELISDAIGFEIKLTY